MATDTRNIAMRVTAVKWDGVRAVRAQEELAAEEPLEIRVRGRAITVTMRSPGSGGGVDADGMSVEDVELAAGFLLTEGVVRSRGDIEGIEHCGRNEMGNVLNVRLGALVHVDFERLTRHVFAASSCGLCGKTSIEQVRGCHPAVETESRVQAEEVLEMVGKMREKQGEFDRTGGLHAAGMFGVDGEKHGSGSA